MHVLKATPQMLTSFNVGGIIADLPSLLLQPFCSICVSEGQWWIYLDILVKEGRPNTLIS